jgi:PAS domain S-box-containing protein
MHTATSAATAAPSAAELQAGSSLWLDLYRRLLAGEERKPLLQSLCAGLAPLLELRGVHLSRKLVSGVIAIEACTQEDALWLELQRLPERWDGTVAGDGPAARALRNNGPALMVSSDEGFLPWRRAAESEGIRAAGAWPLQAAGETWLLQLYSERGNGFADDQRLQLIEQQVGELRRFLDDDARLREQSLLAAALRLAGNAGFITDLHGDIVWSNPAFTRLTGYRAEDVRGKNARILKSGRQGTRYYRELWSTIRSGQVWSGETVDHDRDGQRYVIHQTISPFGRGERISHYLSLHDDISSQKAAQKLRELDAGTDPRSGLLTRASFEAALEEASGGQRPFGLALVSLRRFSEAAQAMGREMQDLVSGEMSERVRKLICGPHRACQSTEGEFLLLLDSDTAAGHEALLNELRLALVEPYPYVGEDIALDYRQVLLRGPQEGRNAEALLRQLDRRMADEPVARAQRQILSR